MSPLASFVFSWLRRCNSEKKKKRQEVLHMSSVSLSVATLCSLPTVGRVLVGGIIKFIYGELG